jgi:hypothetical protein
MQMRRRRGCRQLQPRPVFKKKKKKPIEKNRAYSEGAPLGKKLIIGKTGLSLHRSRDTGRLAELSPPISKNYLAEKRKTFSLIDHNLVFPHNTGQGVLATHRTPPPGDETDPIAQKMFGLHVYRANSPSSAATSKR